MLCVHLRNRISHLQASICHAWAGMLNQFRHAQDSLLSAQPTVALLLQGELRLPQSHPAAAGFPADRCGRREDEISQTTCGRPACRAMIRQAAAGLDQADDLRQARCMPTVLKFVRGFMETGHGAASRVSKAKTSMPCAEPLATNDTDDLTENCSAHYKSMNEYFCLILWQPTCQTIAQQMLLGSASCVPRSGWSAA